jgi:5'-nucleotidase
VVTKALIALVDLGDTIADCTPSLREAMARMREPGEREGDERLIPLPPYLEARRKAVMSTPGFWRELPPRVEGFELMRLLRAEGFHLHVLTKGTHDSPQVWADKVAWCRSYLPDVPVTITEDKARVHGHLLVDDWLPYVQRWQKQWPTGFAIIPSQPWNDQLSLGSRCVRDDGKSRDRLIRVLRNTTWPQSN